MSFIKTYGRCYLRFNQPDNNQENSLEDPVPPTPSTPSHEYVEIGGIKWATMNVGANSVTDTGLYFQWADTQGYTAAQVGEGEGQKYFDINDCKYYNSEINEFTKYNDEDGLTVLLSSDDAVTAAWGGGWRMPTVSEFIALGEAVTTAWTADYQSTGISGLVCTSKADGATLFFPACGLASHGVASGSHECYYLCNSIVDSFDVNNMNGSEYGVTWLNDYSREYGYTVRGVLDA